MEDIIFVLSKILIYLLKIAVVVYFHTLFWLQNTHSYVDNCFPALICVISTNRAQLLADQLIVWSSYHFCTTGILVINMINNFFDSVLEFVKLFLDFVLKALKEPLFAWIRVIDLYDNLNTIFWCLLQRFYELLSFFIQNIVDTGHEAEKR